MSELDQVKTRLPHFPHQLLIYFKDNAFLNEFDSIGMSFDVRDYLNSVNDICGI